MPNKRSNAPGFGSGNGKLKQPTFPRKRSPAPRMPKPESGPERGDSITKGGRAAGLRR